MKKIISHPTANTTPHKGWDYVAHYEGDCEDAEHKDPFAYGSTSEEAIKEFKQQEEFEMEPSSLKKILHLIQELSIGEIIALKDYIWDIHYRMQEREKVKLKELL